jgi:hypothetical protein
MLIFLSIRLMSRFYVTLGRVSMSKAQAIDSDSRKALGN